jgi:hypothetical protein
MDRNPTHTKETLKARREAMRRQKLLRPEDATGKAVVTRRGCNKKRMRNPNKKNVLTGGQCATQQE